MQYDIRNMALYELLLEQYGSVKVQNAGQSFSYKASPAKGGHYKIIKIHSGEEYAVCCHKCGDTRYRLNINHVFGTRLSGVLMDHAAHCWNENCDVLKDLQELIAGRHMKIAPSKEVTGFISLDTIAQDSFENFKRLNCLERMDKVQDGHPAREYLVGRGLNPDELGSIFGVSYCYDNSPEASLAANRIIYPLYHQGSKGLQPVGWQAGVIPMLSPRQKPKYYTSPGCMRSFFMYMFPWSIGCDGMVLVEGPTDAHTIGPPACALLGSNITAKQKALIVDSMSQKSGTLVLIGDPGFEKVWSENYASMVKELGENRVVWFTPEADANSLGRAEIHRRIIDECRRKGVPSPIQW